jgi:folylpolyglutamate synthase/dihydropteroate synthase
MEARWVQSLPQPLALAMPGAHQQDNAATALAAARLLLPAWDEARARAAVGAATLPARCQLLECGDRRLLIDAGHNGASVAAALAVADAQLRPGWRLILALARDKEVERVLAAIPPGLPVLRCGYASPRARGRDDWPGAAQAWPWHADVAAALAALPPGCDACITGSFYLAGEALALFDPG